MVRTFGIILLALTSTSCIDFVSKDDDQKKGSHMIKLVENASVVQLEEVLEKSSQKDKPLLIYFTGFGCVNCRQMEENVFTDNSINKTVEDNFIFVPLFVDDRTKVEEAKWQQSKYSRMKLRTVGQINSHLQMELSHSGTQPYFAVINSEQTLLGTSGYEPNKEKFIKFLKEAIKITN